MPAFIVSGQSVPIICVLGLGLCRDRCAKKGGGCSGVWLPLQKDGQSYVTFLAT